MKPLKTVEEILLGFSKGLKSDFSPYKDAVKALDAHYYQLMLSLVNDSMPQGSYHVNTEVLLEKLSEHFNGEEQDV